MMPSPLSSTRSSKGTTCLLYTSKVNYATDLRIAFSKGLKEYLAGDPEAFDPKKYSACLLYTSAQKSHCQIVQTDNALSVALCCQLVSLGHHGGHEGEQEGNHVLALSLIHI